MEYLLAQSNKGDLLSQTDILPEILDEELEDDCPDLTLPQAHDLTLEVMLYQQIYQPSYKYWKTYKYFLFLTNTTFFL